MDKVIQSLEKYGNKKLKTKNLILILFLVTFELYSKSALHFILKDSKMYENEISKKIINICPKGSVINWFRDDEKNFSVSTFTKNNIYEEHFSYYDCNGIKGYIEDSSVIWIFKEEKWFIENRERMIRIYEFSYKYGFEFRDLNDSENKEDTSIYFTYDLTFSNLEKQPEDMYFTIICSQCFQNPKYPNYIYGNFKYKKIDEDTHEIENDYAKFRIDILRLNPSLVSIKAIKLKIEEPYRYLLNKTWKEMAKKKNFLEEVESSLKKNN